MQKDIHFYATYLLARSAGFPEDDAEQIAWADQFTDELTQADLHGLQTQSEVIGNWWDTQIQMSVLVPFHFLPGNDSDHPWMTTCNCSRARTLVRKATGDDFRLGIALHALQDTFSHQGFSGWRESLNSCFPWYYLKSGLPNVGHAEMRAIPDIANQVWTDPRNGKRIDNRKRALAAARYTFRSLERERRLRYSGATVSAGSCSWRDIEPELKRLFKLDDYDRRVDGLCAMSANSSIDYADVTKRMQKSAAQTFLAAANAHLAQALESFRSLPRVYAQAATTPT